MRPRLRDTWIGATEFALPQLASAYQCPYQRILCNGALVLDMQKEDFCEQLNDLLSANCSSTAHDESARHLAGSTQADESVDSEYMNAHVTTRIEAQTSNQALSNRIDEELENMRRQSEHYRHENDHLRNQMASMEGAFLKEKAQNNNSLLPQY